MRPDKPPALLTPPTLPLIFPEIEPGLPLWQKGKRTIAVVCRDIDRSPPLRTWRGRSLAKPRLSMESA
jgi:hypothetical protein